MSYYGRTVGRAKGVGKMVNWNQGGGPMKAGLGPQINVSTWARRVIARRTNNCCCDPIELTGIRVSIPWGNFPGAFTGNEGIPWNYWQGGANESQQLGSLVGPPRNDVSGGQIQTQNQIYSIATFNKPISGSLSSFLASPTYTPSVPSGTSICVSGLQEVSSPTTSAHTVCIQDSSILVAPVMRYYDIAQRYTPVSQIPGGTVTDTFTPTSINTFTIGGTYVKSGHLTSGSRVLVQPAPGIPAVGWRPTSTVQVNNPAGGVNVDMQSGANNQVALFEDGSKNSWFYGGTLPTGVSDLWQSGGAGTTIDPKYFGGYSTPLMDVSNGGFAINSSSLKSTANPGSTGTTRPPASNRYIGNGFGVNFTNTGRAEGLYASGQTPNSFKRNVVLVQGDLSTNKNEFYSADALYVSDGPVSWLGGDHALFINITSLMQVALKNTVSRGNGNTPSYLWGPPTGGIGGHPVNGTRQKWSPVGTTVEQPPPGGPALPAYISQANSGPWQSWGIKQSPIGGLPGFAPILPAWADLVGSDYGNAFQIDITLDASGNSGRYTTYQSTTGLIPPTNGFNNIFTVGGAPNYDPEKWGATLGDVVEKLRQLTYNAFPSYIIQDILRSKYDCGSDGFDGPVDDIRLSSGSAINKAISSATQEEGGLLSL